jgi:hypothetical protein
VPDEALLLRGVFVCQRPVFLKSSTTSSAEVTSVTRRSAPLASWVSAFEVALKPPEPISCRAGRKHPWKGGMWRKASAFETAG